MLYKDMTEADFEFFCTCTPETDSGVLEQDYKDFIDSLDVIDRAVISKNRDCYLDKLLTHCVEKLVQVTSKGSERKNV